MGSNENGEKRVTYAKIAHILGISRERVRQIANRNKANSKKRRPRVTTSTILDALPNDVETMLTASDVANLLNLHINTVRRWSNQGVLKAYRIGSRGDRRFRQEDVDSFLSEQLKDR